MITGASNVDLAIVLVDARTGVVEQTRRHSLLVSLLGVPHLVICVNKMDLVGYDQKRFDEIRTEFEDFASRLELQDVTFLPISALAGDNVVTRSTNMTGSRVRLCCITSRTSIPRVTRTASTFAFLCST